ncbi:MAG: hypothetical protein JXA30_08110 [Deltaproteobacteria bacterium]|nr:hypothetical protein [Deltaproteobacteria bacterium]
MEGFIYRVVNFLEHPRLPYRLALVSILLTAPSLWVGFHLDDNVGRFLLAGVADPTAKQLLEAYGSPYGIANGKPASNLWQIEHGFAPFWTYEKLLISLWRPLSEFTHRIDFYLTPDSSFEMHAHGLLWFAALVIAVTALYRKLMGVTTVAGVASLLFAIDHTHGFTVGYMANRNATIALFFGALTLYFHDHWRTKESKKAALLAPMFFLCGLLSGESAVAIFGYLTAYTVFLDFGSLRRRITGLLPSLAVLSLWQVYYSSAGYGARGSGLYIDPIHEPIQFACAMCERIPVLALGQLLLPPAEAYNYAPKALAVAIWIGALVFLLSFIAVALPLILRDALARFWALGSFLSLIPICTSHPNNRLLFYVGLGAMALLAQLWHGLVDHADWLLECKLWRRFAHGLIAVVTAFHLFISPLLLPFSACSILLSSAVNRAVERISNEAGLKDTDLVIVNSPDYFLVKLIPMFIALEERPKPRRLRALSFGPIAIEITRLNTNTLSVFYRGGILQTPLLELYRDADIPMHKGEGIDLQGLRIEVTEITRDGRASRVEFRFDDNLDDESFRWMKWDGEFYVPFQPPAVGATVNLPPAVVPYGF